MPEERIDDCLVRYRPSGNDPIREPSPREEVLTYDLGPGHRAEEYAPSPQADRFLLAVSGSRPRLLFIPIKRSARPKEVVTVDLKGTAE